MSLKKCLYPLTAFFVFLWSSGCAQKDTAFWFAPPQICQAQGVFYSDLDTPIYLRISAYGQPSTVTIYQPANPAFTPIVRTVAANSTTTVTLTYLISMLETTPVDQVLNTGLKISATTPISLYYDAECILSPEIFTLKGQNGLGTSFWIPGQDVVINAGYSPQPYNSFDIVATEDNTIVSITPAQAVTGHPAGVLYTETLNHGQTYSAGAVGPGAADHLQGSTVTSTKPIAVSVKDDLLDASSIWGNGQDLTGDQIVPVNQIGTEYIPVRGDLHSPYDEIFILATQNGTTISQDGTYVTTINAGTNYGIFMANPSTYIQTNNPVYVWQLSGLGGELGSGILPPITCTGSDQVAYVRGTSDPLYIMILVENGGQNNFLFNGSGSVLTPGTFAAVPGTGGNWLAAKFLISTVQLPKDSPVLITNSTNLFHMGVNNGSLGQGGSFGYFSNFNSFSVTPSYIIPSCSQILDLHADSIAGAVYSWIGPNGFASSAVNPVRTAITALDTGIYTLTVTYNSCSGTSTTQVALVTGGSDTIFSLGNDTTYCSAFSRVLTSGVTSSYWSTGATGPQITLTAPGIYWAADSNSCGKFADTIVITQVMPPALFDLGGDTAYCGSFSRTLSASAPNTEWSTGASTTAITVTTPGLYWAQDSNQCGILRDSILLVQNQPPLVYLGNDTTLCSGSTLTLNDTSSNATFLWNTGTIVNSINVTVTGNYWLRVTQNACVSKDTIAVTFISPPTAINLGNDTVYCNAFTRTLSSGMATTVWSTGLTGPSITVSAPGLYWEQDSNSCGTVRDSILLTQNPLPVVDLGNDTTLCAGDTVMLNAGNPGATFVWQDNSTAQTYTVTNAGRYIVYVTANNCRNDDSISVFYTSSPAAFSLGGDTTICEDSSIVLNAYQPNVFYHWSNGDSTAMIAVNQPGNYSVTDYNGCGNAVASVNVDTRPCICRLAVPTAFSPNGDGKNDMFGAVYQCPIRYFSMHIYDRWGEKIFETESVSGRWDGYYKNVLQPIGVYVYYITYTDPYTDTQKFLSGNVTLLK